MLYLGFIGMDPVISESFYKETILQRNYRKKVISIPKMTSHDKKNIVSHNITVLCPNLCYNEVCFRGTAPYIL